MSASTRLSVPSISIQDGNAIDRPPSAASFRSDDSLSDDRVRFQMPSRPNADLNSQSSMEMPVEQRLESLPVIVMPYHENPRFVGREEVFEHVKRTLHSASRRQRRVALYGLGGIG